MLDRLRTPLFVIAVILVVLALGAEIGSRFFEIPVASTGAALRQLRQDATKQLQNEDLEDDEKAELLDEMIQQARSASQQGTKPPGVGVPSLGLLDALLLYTLVLMGLGLVVPERVHGRVQGVASLIVSILLLIIAIVLIIATFIKTLIMIALFLAAPFGTLAYLAMYGSFNRGGASAILGASMFFKLAAAVLLVLAHQRFLQNKGLVLLVATSLVGNIIVSFLHALVPIILVSITDAVAAIVIGILAVIWGIVLLVGSVIAIVKAVV
jgi:hypothetical protein